MTALVTQFDSRLEVDLEGFRKNIIYQMSNGIFGIVPLGTTGESPTITEEEFKGIVSSAMDEAKGRIPVIVGTGTNSTDKTIHATKAAEELSEPQFWKAQKDFVKLMENAYERVSKQVQKRFAGSAGEQNAAATAKAKP